ncbi:type I-E CRISPR-associated protein Cas5/CasD [Algiphilus sp.]|uniref:type I-E CRISPR-associated protein Cas5/CasD n=1 Tax=Algiphilus sp. TaxID=1872431 RepID=UPI0025BFD7C7|nr:type I-E CRISPR-associated protein Cas5/CasD [Algiphilus sp.]MCK5771747.1 type I-E CRISPR-associated protein Cas5/CasD [Algiphilus sp.]
MPFLVFQLQAPLAAWGATAVGEYRGTDIYPSESAVFGLVAAALGLRRAQEAEHQALARGYGVVIGVLSSGTLMRDYHTVQMPGQSVMKGRPHATRRDELAPARTALTTIISKRDYRENAGWLVALQAKADAPHALDQLGNALAQPRFVLYLGRKSCPLAAPLRPRVLGASSAMEAFAAYAAEHEQTLEANRDRWGNAPVEPLPALSRLVWGEGVDAGIDEPSLTAVRKDRLISRGKWQFGDRVEHVAFLEEEG